jgi:YfiH family protein
MEPFVLEKAANGCDLLYIRGWMERDSGLSAGFTSRHGGVSKGGFNSLNIGLHVEDNPQLVVKNRKRLAEALHVKLNACTYAEQVHGNEVQEVSRVDAGTGVDSRETAFQSKDAFVTNQSGLFIHALFADCVPLFFYDPVQRAVGVAHAGWKGTVLRIAGETVEAMQRLYGSNPENILAAVGPSIQACCYEVNKVVMARVFAVMEELEINNFHEEGQPPIYESKPNDKYNLNLQQMNRQIMIKAGILPTHIEVSSLCTSCRTDLFYSHRKEEGKTGRMAAWIGLY